MTVDPALARLGLAVAGEAGRLLLDGLGRQRTEVDTKTTGTDMVTEMDRASERLIVGRILDARPDDGILGEEGADHAGTSGVRWIIDPLDGTTNYLYGHPGFAVSIAAEVDGEPVVGVVVDPVHGEQFVGVRGQGATRNQTPLRAPPAPPLHHALVATGFAYDAGRRRAQAALLGRIIGELRDIRRMGAAAVDLCSVALGRVNAYYERGLAPWDLAAGTVIAREAGVEVTDLTGGEPTGEFLVAAPAPLAGALRELLAAAGAAELP